MREFGKPSGESAVDLLACLRVDTNHIRIFKITNHLIDKASTSLLPSFELDVSHNEIPIFLWRIPHELICSYSETQFT
jgi:hypothetical protein